jgi:restriction system protein
MARRQRIDSGGATLALLAGIFLIWRVTRALQHADAMVIEAGIVVGIALLVWRMLRPRRLRTSALVKANRVIAQQIEPLVRKRAQLVRYDAYGNLQMEKWAKETKYFVKHNIQPILTADEWSALVRHGVSLSRVVQDRTAAAGKDRSSFKAFSPGFSSGEFEIFCAEQLQSSGWQAQATAPGRDQGIDVVAEKAGIRVVLQCKLYSSPVGNHAVQEIVAGRAFEQADYGAVVSNNSYTSAAEQLASASGVLLLHYSELANLENMLRSLDGLAGRHFNDSRRTQA